MNSIFALQHLRDIRKDKCRRLDRRWDDIHAAAMRASASKSKRGWVRCNTLMEETLRKYDRLLGYAWTNPDI